MAQLAHRIFRSVPALVMILACSVSNISFAQEPETKKVFVDSPVKLPMAPQQADLLRFYVNGSQTFYIDSKSLSIVDDGSIRYTLVGISQSGAQSVSYEGLRCDSNEKRLFAFGRKDGAWSESRRKEWDAISAQGINQQHGTLAWDFVCEGAGISGNIEKILRRIRYNESLRRHP